jgi:hypothetical protein
MQAKCQLATRLAITDKSPQFAIVEAFQRAPGSVACT